jgi:hypothetical protein
MGLFVCCVASIRDCCDCDVMRSGIQATIAVLRRGGNAANPTVGLRDRRDANNAGDVYAVVCEIDL